MATSKIFQKAPIEVPNRSGFNISHKSGFSAPVGTLVPFFWDFLLPKDEIDLGSSFQVQLPPLATDFIGDIEGRIEYFCVPVRTLFGGWKDFIVNPLDDSTNPSDIEGQLAKYLIGAKFSGSVTVDNLISDTTSSNPTYTAIYDSSLSRDKYESIMQSAMDDSFYKFREYVRSGAGITQNGGLLEKIGAGSLSDYLGFKVSDEIDGSISIVDSIENSLNSFSPNEVIFEEIANQLNSPDSPTSVGATFTEIFNGYSIVLTVYLNIPNPMQAYVSAVYTLNVDAFDDLDVSINNILAHLAYHKIFDDWYRDSKIQKSLFRRQVANTTSASSVANMPWITSGAESKIYFEGDQLLFANGDNLFDLHQRNFEKDYFTSATPEPQAGAPAKVSFNIENASGEFTIASLRAANGLQQFLDRNNIAGFRYGDVNFAQYGVYPPDEITQRAIYLGSQTIPIHNKSVYQQSGDGGSNTNNPFNIIGAKYANAMGVSNTDFVVENYEVKDYCIVMGIFSLVPKVRYSSGTRRFFHYNDVSDIAFPMLAGVGDQEILKRELLDVYSGEGNKEVFGYTQRYAEYKFIDDQIHGLLRDGENLKSFALQRSFSGDVELGSDFITIPRDYLDQVSAADYEISKYGCWTDCHIYYYKSSTLPAYSIPTLEDLKNTHTVIIDKNGKRL